MVKKTGKTRPILIAATVITLTHPMFSSGQTAGHDWYCTDPAAHAQYQKHLKIHLENQADTIANELAAIYNNPSLSAAQKHSKTLAILNQLLQKGKPGLGVAD